MCGYQSEVKIQTKIKTLVSLSSNHTNSKKKYIFDFFHRHYNNIITLSSIKSSIYTDDQNDCCTLQLNYFILNIILYLN